MIAKKVPTPKKLGSSVKNLVEYIADPAKQQSGPGAENKSKSDSIDNLVSYIDRDGASAKIRITNCMFDNDVTAAIKEIQSVQKANTRSKSNKNYHLIISFQEGERPSDEILKVVEDRIVESIGYGEHQRISAVHTNTTNLHIHVAINKVNPTTFRNVETIRDYPKMLEECRKLENEFGLEKDQGVRSNQRKRMSIAKEKEAQTGIISLETWIKENVKGSLFEVLDSENTSWEKLHNKLNENGLDIRKRGAGLVIQNIEDGIVIKASSIGREFSKGKLEKTLGSFEENSNSVIKDPKSKYELQPIQPKSTGRDKLWEEYSTAFSEKKKLHIELKEDRKKYIKMRLDSIRERKNESYKSNILKYAQKREIQAALQVEQIELKNDINRLFNKRRDEINEKYTVSTWTAFLQEKAKEGNEAALKLLRYKKSKIKDKGNFFLGKDNGSSANTKMTFDVDKRGRVTYQTGSGWILDTGPRVLPGSDNKDVLEASLRIAIGRFGKRINVNGSDKFVKAVKDIAKQEHVNVTINGERIVKGKERGVSK